MPPIYTSFLYLMTYSFLGWICESAYKSIFQKKVINSGFLNGPLCPIYGFGAVFILLLLTPFKNYPILVFLLGILSTSLLEYFTSWLMEILFHMRWWDYSKHKFNIKGRVCLLNATLFGIMSIVVMYFVHPVVMNFYQKIDSKVQIVIAILLLGLLIIDGIVSTASVLNMNKSLKQMQTFLHSVFENSVDTMNQKLLKENEVIIQNLIRKRNHLMNAFPTIKHNYIDLSASALTEMKEKIRNWIDELKN